MSMAKKYGVKRGEQVPLAIANKQAAELSGALAERERTVAEAAATAVRRVLKGGEPQPKRTHKALRAPVKREKE